MKVLKFGGSSVGTTNGIRNVKKIVSSQKGQVIVVVSALGGVTDQLIKTAQMASVGNKAYEDELCVLTNRHYDLINDNITTGNKRDELLAKVEQLLGELRDIFQGIYLIKDLSRKTNDTILSYGERLSSLIVAEVTGAAWKDSREFIKTERKQGKHILNAELTNKLVKDQLSDLPQLTLIPGFIATDKNTGEVTNLGRGGSDYTAAIVAAALNAESLEIWTDVDGFMTADPRVIHNAYTISSLTYVEATELCNFGAKVVYPPTIWPVYHKNIPILIKNTFNPEAQGTVIRQGTANGSGKAIKGISSIDDTCLITVQGLGMVGVIGVNRRIFSTLAEHGISVFMVSQASSENSTSIGVRTADAVIACEVLDKEFSKEIELGEMFPMKADIACAQGASETNISFVVNKKLLRKSLNVIHDSFFLSEYQVLNLFICGIGTVGHSLITQIESQREKLMRENGLQLNVVGIANSKKGLFTREGINLHDYKSQLLEKGKDCDLNVLLNEVTGMNIFNAVFVDCTANSGVASIYEQLLQHNISVVAANKIAASSPYENYIKLKQTAHQRGVKFLFETNVGAGLPIINTINDLIHSGDKILKIEAVLSGTLNYIFNSLSAETTLSKAIAEAKQKGFSEPDPRIDLSGKDVIRKLVILGREAGYRLDQEDVEKHLFIPDQLMEGSLDDFWKHIPELDADFETRRQHLAEQGKRWRFVARLFEGKATVGLEEVASNHPFYGLESSNNIILLTTERYHEYPMMIQGYGAGASVTAAGVFADIMSIANV